MRAFCFTCQDDTIVHRDGRCGFCDTQIVTPHKATAYPKGRHSYLGTDEIYAAAYEQYLEVRSIRKVAAGIWQAYGYASLQSCANTLSEAWIARGWPTFTRGHANMVHGKSRRNDKNPEHRRQLRLERGETRGVKCAGTRTRYPRKGHPCGLYAKRGSAYCHYHDPAREEERNEQLRRVRARRLQEVA